MGSEYNMLTLSRAGSTEVVPGLSVFVEAMDKRKSREYCHRVGIC